MADKLSSCNIADAKSSFVERNFYCKILEINKLGFDQISQTNSLNETII